MESASTWLQSIKGTRACGQARSFSCYRRRVGVELPELLVESPIASWVCDRATMSIVAANPAALAALGPELIGQSLRALWIGPSRDEAELVRAVRAKTRASWTQRTCAGAAVAIEAAVTAYGAAAWLVQAVYIGAVTAGGPSLDVVARLGSLVQHLPDAIAIHDRDGRCAYISPAVRHILGREPAEFIGTVGSQFTHPEDVVRARPIYREMLDNPGAARTFLSRVQGTRGGAQWIEATVTNLLDEPSVRGVATLVRDVSGRVETQNQLEDARRRFAYLLSATSAVTYTAR